MCTHYIIITIKINISDLYFCLNVPPLLRLPPCRDSSSPARWFLEGEGGGVVSLYRAHTHLVVCNIAAVCGSCEEQEEGEKEWWIPEAHMEKQPS